jgi:Kef-type K+ transport system membrane component KefB
MTSSQAVLLLFDLALILVVANVFGAVARRFDQPPVVGEILAGILLGPSLFHGAISGTLFPTDSRLPLAALADIGVAVFMFLVGLEFDYDALRRGRASVLSTSLGAMVLPFGLGCLLGLYLWRDHTGLPRVGFILFFGVAMSITAFPVLARILVDRGMQRTHIGAVALASAALGDVIVWCLLAGILAVIGPHQSWHILLFLPYLLVMLFVVRPLLGKLVSTGDGRSATTLMLVVLIVLLLVSGGLTEWFGLHFIFGAFLAGVVMPRRETQKLRTEVADRLRTVGAALLPVYFVIAGLNVDLSKVGTRGLGELGLIMVAAIGGKFLGAYGGARGSGQPTRSATTLGILMNSRGLTELIVLSVGLQFGLLDKGLYSLMVVMAVITTAMTGPLLRLSYPRSQLDADLLGEKAPAGVGS